MNERTTEDGEIVERSNLPTLVDNSGLTAIIRAEIDAQIVTARQFPRNVQRVVSNITSLATMDEEMADECLYALVRKKKGRREDDAENKPIEGPSIRLAEIAAQCYGNCRIEARVIAVNRAEKYVEAEGIFHDLETNMASKATVRRRVSTSKGYLFSEDMINVTANAACSIAKRNAILAGIPRGVYRPAYMAARKIVAGTAETLVENRAKALSAFAHFGVKPEQVFEALSVDGEVGITVDHIATLRGMFAALKSGEATVEEMFPRPAAPGPDSKDVKADLDSFAAGEQPSSAVEPSSDQSAEPMQDPETGAAPSSTTEQPSSKAEESEAGNAASPDNSSHGGSKPTTASQYVIYAQEWIGSLDSSGEGEERWKAEKVLRNKLNLEPEARDELAAKLKARVSELRASAANTGAVDPIAVARKRGADAYRAGHSRKAVPPEYRTSERQSEASAWQEAFDAARAEDDQRAK